ncbi:MAG: TraR/DksA family transcriptional regulator [Candidatus Babeliales bacterium]
MKKKAAIFEKAKEELLKRQRDLEEDIKELQSEEFSDDKIQDPSDQMWSSTMENVRNTFELEKIAEYKRVLQALSMIEDGTYGICIDCSAEISEKRLALYPNAMRCISCQEMYEKKGST